MAQKLLGSAPSGTTDAATKGYVDTGLAGKQASDADLTDIAGLSASNDDIIQRKAGVWANRTLAQVRTDLGVGGGTATLVVAANGATAKQKARADYVCDGTADQVEIQAAIDALPTNGGKVGLTGGLFTITAPIKVNRDNVFLEGEGYGTPATGGTGTDPVLGGTRIAVHSSFTGSWAIVCALDSPNRCIFGTQLRDFSIQGYNAPADTGGVFWQVTWGGMDRVFITYMRGTAFYSTAYDADPGTPGAITGTAAPFDCFFNNLRIRENFGDGMVFDQQSTDHVFFGCIIDLNEGDGMRFADALGVSAAVQIHGCYVYSNTGTGIVANSWQTKIYDTRVQDNHLGGLYISGAAADGAAFEIVGGNYRNNSIAADNTYDGININLTGVCYGGLISAVDFCADAGLDNGALTKQRYGINVVNSNMNDLVIGPCSISRKTAGATFGTAFLNDQGTNTLNLAAAAQPLDGDLTAIAALSPSNDDVVQRKSGAWTNRTPAQVKTDLSLTKSDVGLGSVDNTADTAKPISTATQSALDAKQGLDSDLTTIAGLTATTDSFLQSKSSAWAARTVAQVKTDLGLTGTNSGDQASIVGITGTKAQFDTAVTDGNILYVGDVTQYTDEAAQDAVGAMLADTATIDFTYTDGTPELKADVINDSITYAKLQNVSATDRFLGRDTAGAGDVEEIAPSAARSILNVADGATANDTDANLKARANHTGTQAISTVSGLQTALDLKAPLASPALTGAITMDAATLATDTTTGLKIGTSTSQKLGFFNSTPIVQPAATDDLGTALSNLGLRASGTAYPITTSGAVALSGSVSLDRGGSAGDVSIIGTGSTVKTTTYGTGNAGTLLGINARGTAGAPLRVKSGDLLYRFGAGGAYAADDSSAATLSTTSQVRLSAYANEDWTSAARGAWLAVESTSPGASTVVERMRLGRNGEGIDFSASAPNSYMFRFKNNSLTVGRNAAASADVSLFKMNTSDQFELMSDVLHTDAKNIAFGTTTGSKIGTSTSQKLGFFNATPVVQRSAITSPSADVTSLKTAVDALRQALIDLGLTA